MNAQRVGWPVLVGSVLLLAALQLQLRPLLPVDETRYLSVAWEMWWRKDFVLPWLNGEPYSHKPPLLFWLIHGVWVVSGVSEIAARTVPVALSLLALWLTARLGARLWSDRQTTITALAPWLLLGGVFWSHFYTLIQFDLLLAVAALLAWHGVLQARRQPMRGWPLVGVGIGLGVLAKGPVILVPVLPALLFAPWWARQLRPCSWLRWYLGAAAALLLGAGIALAWAIPAGIAGGETYRQAIFWGQSAGRIMDSFAHRSPWWSYALWLPLMWLPWLLWPRLWRSLRRAGWDDGLRFCMAVLVPALLVFSLISGKQGKYLLPLFPLIGLLMARVLAPSCAGSTRYRLHFMAIFMVAAGAVLLLLPSVPDVVDWFAHVPPLWGTGLIMAGALLLFFRLHMLAAVRVVALGTLLCTAVIHLALVVPARPAYQLEAVSRVLSELQASGHQVAWRGKYHGQFHFLGRLQQRIEPLAAPGQLRAWVAAHPDGYLLVSEKASAAKIPAALLVQSYRGGRLVLWPVAALLDEPARLDALAANG